MDQFDTIAASEKGAFLHLFAPAENALAYVKGEDGEPDESKPIGLNMIGTDSAEYRRKHRLRVAKVAKSRSRRPGFEKMSVDEIAKDLEKNEGMAIQDIADSVTGFVNMPLPDDIKEFSRENVVEMLKRYPSILEQAQDFLANKANLFQKNTTP